MVAEISNGSIAMANYRPDTREVLIYKRKDDGVTIDESIRRITLKENASIDERNAKIRERHSKGETLATLARDFGRTPDHLTKNTLLALCLTLLFGSQKAEAYGLLFHLFGADAKICATVVDDDGKPVENAKVLATYRQYNWGPVNNVKRLTDANGYAELVGRCIQGT